MNAATPQELINAVKSGVTSRGVLFGDGGKPDGVTDKPYVVAWFDGGTITNRTLKSRDGLRVVCVFHCVGRSPEAARHAVRALRAVILGLHGTTVGEWMVQMPSNDPAIPLNRDDDATPVIWSQADEWTFRLTPA